MSQRFLVTGAAGFIGSHLVRRLISGGDEVYAVDNLSTGVLDNLSSVRKDPKLHLIVDSVTNWPMMNDTVGKCDAVFHLAASEGIRRLVEDPVETMTTNVRGAEIVLDCCKIHGKRVFFGSGSEIYGKSQDQLHEDGDLVLGPPPELQWSYGCTKAFGEFLGLAYYEHDGLPVTIGRFFNVVGPGQTGLWGQVLPRFVEAASKGEPLCVYGSGEQTRCFLHVDDALDAILGLMDNEASIGQIYNIGSEEEISILALAELVKDCTGSSSPIERLEYTEAVAEGFKDPTSRRPNNQKLRNRLGWEPTRSISEIVYEVVG